MNLRWNIIIISLIEYIVIIQCTAKKRHKHHHSIVSQSTIPQSLTSQIAEDNYNPEESMCIWKDDLDNIYNLSLLQKTDSYWQVDLRTTEQQSFKIQLMFNFCNNFPKPCQKSPSNNNEEEKIEQNEISLQHYGAYQSISFQNHQSLDQCSAFGQYDKSLIELIDYYEVGQGIKIVYRGGEICTSSENPKDQQKEKTITFLIYCSSDKDKDENFTSLPIDGMSITSCNPILKINHPGGCYQGQMNEQRHKLTHPIIVFIVMLFLFSIISVTIIITIFNCIENDIKGFTAIPYYQDIKLILQKKQVSDNLCSITGSFSNIQYDESPNIDSNLSIYKPV